MASDRYLVVACVGIWNQVSGGILYIGNEAPMTMSSSYMNEETCTRGRNQVQRSSNVL